MTLPDAVWLIGALALPWACGVAILAALPGNRGRLQEPGAALPGDAVARAGYPVAHAGEAAWLAGAGWLVGALAVTLVMRVLAKLGIAFDRAAIAVPLCVVAAAGAALALRARGSAARDALRRTGAALAGAGLPRARRIAWLLLLAWLAVRFTLLLAEVLWQPLYPWDAWIQWATKAKVWYSLRTIVPFDFAEQWFAANGASYFDASPHYPATIPLWQVWTSVMLGRWDDSLMNLFWWQTAVAIALVSYAALRDRGYAPLGALVGTWLVASLPLANVHVALAGYADLPMAAYYTAAAVAAMRAVQSRRVGDAAVALMLVAGCPLIKTPGIIWAMTIVAAAMVGAWPRVGPRLVGLGAAAFAVVLLVAARYAPTVLGYTVQLTFAPAWGALRDSFFMLGNWHLLWYAVVAVAVLGRREAIEPPLRPFTTLVAAGGAFLLIVFGVTNARDWVADQTTVNRATLHIAPLAALWALVVFRRWALRDVAPAPTADPARDPTSAHA